MIRCTGVVGLAPVTRRSGKSSTMRLLLVLGSSRSTQYSKQAVERHRMERVIAHARPTVPGVREAGWTEQAPPGHAGLDDPYRDAEGQP